MSGAISNKKFYENGLRFECTKCSNCCRHEPGYVFLIKGDLEKIGTATGLSQDQAREKYCRVVNVGIAQRISLQEKANFDCIFWEESGCSIYKYRPHQCRSYPFWSAIVTSKESWEREGKNCPGINRGEMHEMASIDSWIQQRERAEFLT